RTCAYRSSPKPAVSNSSCTSGNRWNPRGTGGGGGVYVHPASSYSCRLTSSSSRCVTMKPLASLRPVVVPSGLRWKCRPICVPPLSLCVVSECPWRTEEPTRLRAKSSIRTEEPSRLREKSPSLGRTARPVVACPFQETSPDRVTPTAARWRPPPLLRAAEAHSGTRRDPRPARAVRIDGRGVRPRPPALRDRLECRRAAALRSPSFPCGRRAGPRRLFPPRHRGLPPLRGRRTARPPQLRPARPAGTRDPRAGGTPRDPAPVLLPPHRSGTHPGRHPEAGAAAAARRLPGGDGGGEAGDVRGQVPQQVQAVVVQLPRGVPRPRPPPRRGQGDRFRGAARGVRRPGSRSPGTAPRGGGPSVRPPPGRGVLRA